MGSVLIIAGVAYTVTGGVPTPTPGATATLSPALPGVSSGVSYVSDGRARPEHCGDTA